MTQGQLGSLSPFEIYSRCRKHLVFADSHGVTDVLADIRRMVATAYPVEWNTVGRDTEVTAAPCSEPLVRVKHAWPQLDESDALRSYLEHQPMGTHLYIAASWASARLLSKIAETLGYANEDIQIRGYGQKYHQVYCVACYTTNPIANRSTVVCQQCGKLVSVSDHYSRRLDAVLGYLTIDNSMKKGNP